MFTRTLFILTVALAAFLPSRALAIDPDPWVLFCHTDPTESRIGEYADNHLKLEAKFAGAIRQGWWGSNCTIYGKLKATRLDPAPVEVVADLPASPNYIVLNVSLGPVPPGGDRPSVQFSDGASLTQGIYFVQFKEGRLVCKATGYVPTAGADPKNYFALREWRFMVIKQSEAEKWREALRIRASLYSID